MLFLFLHQLDLNSEIKKLLPATLPFTIGRSAKADVRTELLSKYVSRIHVRVTPGDGWTVEDLDSQNGIYDDQGERMAAIHLKNPGDNCWVAAPRNSLGSICLTIEDVAIQPDRDTIRVDLNAWVDRATTAIDELQELIDKERS